MAVVWQSSRRRKLPIWPWEFSVMVHVQAWPHTPNPSAVDLSEQFKVWFPVGFVTQERGREGESFEVQH